MKKLMILVAAVVLACAGQAASVDWKMNISGKGDAWSGANAYVMAFNGADYDAVINLLTVTGSENMATDLGAYALTLGTGGTSAAVASTRKTATASGTVDGVTGDTMFWVIFTEGKMDANSAFAWTDVADISAYDYEAGSYSPGTFGFTSASNSGTIASVPEPTSAMLLVLGMAGLALRRKRA